MSKYYTADITWCNCDCTNTKCDRHICHMNPMLGTGFYSMADYSNKCPEYSGKKKEE